MGTFCKKVEAVQCTGDNFEELREFSMDPDGQPNLDSADELWVEDWGDWYPVSKGEWVVKQGPDNFMKVKDKDFRAEYAPCSP
jgi:hypothetical protein